MQVFTGIVQELGEVIALDSQPDSARLVISGPRVAAEAGLGDSIAVNGVCLTVTQTADGSFSADVMGETLARSSLGALVPGSPVNLERPVRADGRLDGHIVQGHVDGTGRILDRRPARNWQVLRISIPRELFRYIAKKGSVAIDGVSLTVSELSGEPGDGEGGWLEVSLIPQTLALTTLGSAAVGDVVNLEVDVIAKYVERLLTPGARA
jgi:riboflavin synthase